MQTWDRALHKAFRDGQPAELEFEHESPQGPRVYEARLFPEPDERGEVVSVLCFTRDVTSLRKLVADLKGAEEQLFAAQKMEAIGQLAGGVAHDFNNLMTIVTGYGALMLKQIPRAIRSGGARGHARAGDRASALTRQLLAFSRRQVIVPRVMDLNASVEEARKSMKRMLREDIELNVALAPNCGRSTSIRCNSNRS